MLVGVFEFFVESDGFEFVEESVDACLPRRVVVGAETVCVDVDEMRWGAVGELSVEFAGDGECW